MLYDPARHEGLRPIAWDEDHVRETIKRIVGDTESRFSPGRYWPVHPRDVDGNDDPNQLTTPLYYGACGVIWALHYLQAVGAAQLSRSYVDDLDSLLTQNRTWLGSSASRAIRPSSCWPTATNQQPIWQTDLPR